MTPWGRYDAYRDCMSLAARLRPHTDVLFAGVLTALLVAELLAHAGAELERAVPAALVAGAGLSMRRRTPVVGFLLVAAGLPLVVVFAPEFDGESLSFVAVYIAAHYSVGRWASGREAVVAAILVVASMVVFALGDAAANDQGFDDIGLGLIAFTIVFVGGPWAAGLAIRLRKEREAVLNAENRRLADEQEELARRAVAEERSRIARELHDVVSHAISVTVLQARGARRLLGSDEAAVRRALDAIEHTNTSALGDMRRLLAVLRDTDGPATEDSEHPPAPSLEHLPALLDQVRESGVPVELEVFGDAGVVPPGVDLSAYRIVQEALTNVIKHAGSARATGAPGLLRRRAGDLHRRRRHPGEQRRWEGPWPDRHQGAGVGGGRRGRGRASCRRRVRGAGPAALRAGGLVIRVVLADDQPLVRTGLRMILSSEPDIEVVGEAEDGAAAIARCAELSPDVVLMDVRMPGVDGIQATRAGHRGRRSAAGAGADDVRPRRVRLRRAAGRR